MIRKEWRKEWKDQNSTFHFVRKDKKKCEITKIGHFESFWTTLVGKDGKKCKMIKIGQPESIWKIFMGKMGKSGK